MSDRRLRYVALALVAAGLGIAGYLTWVHYADLEAVCVGGGGGCERVQNSEYAELAGIPVAVIGLAGYVAIGVTLLIPGANARMAGALFGLVGCGFALYLTYLELFVIDAICQWCVANAAVITALAVAAVTRAGRPVTD
jgi:uncharacterized membrane protein